MRTTPPVRSITSTPSTMPRRMASSRSRSTRSSPIVPPIAARHLAELSSSSPSVVRPFRGEVRRRLPGGELAGEPEKPLQAAQQRRASTSAAPAAMSRPTRRPAASSQRVWVTVSPTEVSGSRRPHDAGVAIARLADRGIEQALAGGPVGTHRVAPASR